MMDVIFQTVKLRYLKPIQGMVNNFEFAGFIASLATVANSFLEEYIAIFITDINLIYSLVTLLFLDTLTGLYASWKKEIKINSFGLRSTVVKIIEYSIALLSFTVLSNMHVSLDWVQTWTYIFLCGIEIKSIQENLFLKDTVTRKLFSEFWKIFKKKNNIDLNDKS